MTVKKRWADFFLKLSIVSALNFLFFWSLEILLPGLLLDNLDVKVLFWLVVFLLSLFLIFNWRLNIDYKNFNGLTWLLLIFLGAMFLLVMGEKSFPWSLIYLFILLFVSVSLGKYWTKN